VRTDYNRVKELESENYNLKSEIQRLKKLLDDAGVAYSVKSHVYKMTEDASLEEGIINKNITTEQIDLFIPLFHGRTDVFAKRFVSKVGNVGYSLGCNNFWKQGICPKRDRLKIKCAECANRSWIKLNRRILREHLEGHKENCTDVIGVYPMLEDETCYFLVFDFDNHDKKKDPLHRKFIACYRKFCYNDLLEG